MDQSSKNINPTDPRFGRVVVEGGRVTVVDEDAVKERFAAAVHDRVFRFPQHVQRWAELGRLVEPFVIDFYQRWYGVPVEPAYTYNAKRPPVVAP